MKIEIFLKRNQKTYQSFPSDINSPNCAAAWWKLPCTTCIGRSGYPFHIVFGLPAAAALQLVLDVDAQRGAEGQRHGGPEHGHDGRGP